LTNPLFKLKGLRTEKQSTWCASDIATQPDSLFAFSREQSRQVENRLNNIKNFKHLKTG
jgi:hypothetical protein